jgi:hypothetical protein
MSRSTPRDEWFRSADWDREHQAGFEAGLARARPANRPQYRRIKASALLVSGDRVREDAGRALVEDNLAQADLPQHERTWALATLARLDVARGRLADAERSLRAALAIGGPDASGTTGEEEIELAEILLAKGDDADIREAQALLDRRATRMPVFVRSRYRLAVAQARVSIALADASGAAAWASTALDLAAAEHSGLRHHPALGLIEVSEAELASLRDVAHGPTSVD